MLSTLPSFGGSPNPDGTVALWVFSALGTVWLIRALWRLRRPVPGSSGETGTATIEFVLVFPILLFLVLLLLQSTLVLAANFVVQQAAYAAARSAVVQVPRDLAAEPRNYIRMEGGSAKYDTIREAAWLAVMPVCGRDNAGPIEGGQIADGVESHLRAYGVAPPAWVDNFVAARARYAGNHTEVRLRYQSQTPDGLIDFPLVDGSWEYGPQDPIMVEVVHDLNLAVPYVRGLFADGSHTTADGRGAYARVRASSTLSNQGVDDQLPEPPTIPRVDSDEERDELLRSLPIP